MKRLAWLLIAVFCTAMAQVQPVVPIQANDEDCCCCQDQPGACGMPDCAPAPAGSLPVAGIPAKAALRREARKLSPAPSVAREPFYARFVPRPAQAPAPHASPEGASAADVPLFKAHCSFLI